jgi:hypothetical protein
VHVIVRHCQIYVYVELHDSLALKILSSSYCIAAESWVKSLSSCGEKQNLIQQYLMFVCRVILSVTVRVANNRDHTRQCAPFVFVFNVAVTASECRNCASVFKQRRAWSRSDSFLPMSVRPINFHWKFASPSASDYHLKDEVSVTYVLNLLLCTHKNKYNWKCIAPILVQVNCTVLSARRSAFSGPLPCYLIISW